MKLGEEEILVSDIIDGLEDRGLLPLLELVALDMAVTPEDIASRSKMPSISAARAEFYRRLKDEKKKSTTEIGLLMDRDGSGVGVLINAARAKKLAAA